MRKIKEKKNDEKRTTYLMTMDDIAVYYCFLEQIHKEQDDGKNGINHDSKACALGAQAAPADLE